MLAWLLALPRSVKRIISVVIDTVFLTLSLLLAFVLTQNGNASQFQMMLLAFGVTLPLTLLIFIVTGKQIGRAHV